MQDKKPVPSSQRHICEYLAKVQVSITKGSGGQDEINSSKDNSTGSSKQTGKHSCHFLKLASVETEETSPKSEETDGKKADAVASGHRCQFVSVDRGGSPVKSSQETNVEASSTSIPANSSHNCPYLAKVQSILKSLEDSSSKNHHTGTKPKDLETSEKPRPWIKPSSGNSETSVKDSGTSAEKNVPFQVKGRSPAEKGVLFKEKDNPSAQRDIPLTGKTEQSIEEREPSFSRSGPSLSKSDSPFSKIGPSFSKSDPSFSKSGPSFSKSDPSFSKSDPSFSKSDPLTNKADEISSNNTETQKELPDQQQNSCSSLDATKHSCYFLEVAKRGLEKLNEASKKSGSEKQPVSFVSKDSVNLKATGERKGISNENNKSISDPKSGQKVQRMPKDNKSISPEEPNRHQPELKPSRGSNASRSSTKPPIEVEERDTQEYIDHTTTRMEQRITNGDKHERSLEKSQKINSKNIPRINKQDRNTTTEIIPEISKGESPSKQTDSIPKVSCSFLHRKKDSSPQGEKGEIICEYLNMNKSSLDSPTGNKLMSGKISKSPTAERTESPSSSNSTPGSKIQCSYLNSTSNVQAHSCEYIRKTIKPNNSPATVKKLGNENVGNHQPHIDVMTKCDYLEEISKDPKLNIGNSLDDEKHSKISSPEMHTQMEMAIGSNKPELDYLANNRYSNNSTNNNGGSSNIDFTAKEDILRQHSSSICSNSTPTSRQLWKPTSSSCTNLISNINQASHQTGNNYLIPVTTSNHSWQEVASDYKSPTNISSQSWKQNTNTYKNPLSSGDHLGLQGASITTSPVTTDGRIQETSSFPVTRNYEPSVNTRDFSFSKTEPVMNASFGNSLRNISSAKDVHKQRPISTKISFKHQSHDTSSPQRKTKNPFITKQSNRNTLLYTKRLCTVMTRNEVNNSNKQFLVKLAKYGKETSFQMDCSESHFLRTNRIIHAANSFEIWNYVDINKKSFRGNSPFNYSRLKTERGTLGDHKLAKVLGTSAGKDTLAQNMRNTTEMRNPVTRGTTELSLASKKHNQMTSTSSLSASGRNSYDVTNSKHQPKESSTVRDNMSSDHLPRASVTSNNSSASTRNSYDVNTSQHQPKESYNTSHQSRASAKKGRRRKSKKKNKGTNDPINSDIEDLETNDRDLLNSISPFSDCSRPSDLDLSRIQE